MRHKKEPMGDENKVRTPVHSHSDTKFGLHQTQPVIQETRGMQKIDENEKAKIQNGTHIESGRTKSDCYVQQNKSSSSIDNCLNSSASIESACQTSFFF